ncbi:hypothetical protein QWZ10_21545 [Paracoccus cavernae]|uniref:Autotransporter outer membrane beta-barrel domain-containing protein n=1 Tax=Paracoccus cavernae TaxID=1571207 RepID=A0ABT8DA67_9RHOB|nr:hypothetical protein [Paracoccus cavernae]
MINGAIANGGTILYDDTAGHAMNGSLMNTPGGTVDVITSLNGNGNNVINHSNYNVMAGGTATGIDHFANRQGGTLDIRADAATGTTGSLTATTITNDVGGTINNAGTLTADLLRSSGTLNSTGTLNGRVAIGRAGDAVLSNVITGQLHNSGDFSTGGNLSVGGFVNAGEGRSLRACDDRSGSACRKHGRDLDGERHFGRISAQP